MSPVHNHGPNEGPGLGCGEAMVDGKLRGHCLYVPDNVTRIHPAPSIPNPLMFSPIMLLTDEELGEAINSAHARAAAAARTARVLERELIRRHEDSPASPHSGDDNT